MHSIGSFLPVWSRFIYFMDHKCSGSSLRLFSSSLCLILPVWNQTDLPASRQRKDESQVSEQVFFCYKWPWPLFKFAFFLRFRLDGRATLTTTKKTFCSISNMWLANHFQAHEGFWSAAIWITPGCFIIDLMRKPSIQYKSIKVTMQSWADLAQLAAAIVSLNSGKYCCISAGIAPSLCALATMK